MKDNEPSYVIRPVAHLFVFSVEGKTVGFILERCFSPQVGLMTTKENGSDLFIGKTFDDVIRQYFNSKKE